MVDCAVFTLRWWCPGASALYVRSPLCVTLLWVETPRVGITVPGRSVPVSANSFYCLVAKSCLTLLQCHGTVACQAPLSMGFSRQEFWSRLSLSFSRRYCQPRDWTHVSCIRRRFLYHWATREALISKPRESGECQGENSTIFKKGCINLDSIWGIGHILLDRIFNWFWKKMVFP